MPKRTDLKRILLIGSGPIIIGQACEFDYSGTQACKALREEGYEGCPRQQQPGHHHDGPGAGRSHLRRAAHRGISGGHHPQGSAAGHSCQTMGGQTALNLAIELSERGILAKYGVELIGAKEKAIKLAESREQFKEVLERVGVDFPKSGGTARKNLAEALAHIDR